MTDEFDLFQGDFMSYSQLVSQMTSIRVLGPSVPNMMLLERYHTIPLVRPPECPRRKHRPTQDTSSLVVKSDQETHTACLSLGGCFVSVDLFFILFQRL
jgi:hypothetical protein